MYFVTCVYVYTCCLRRSKKVWKLNKTRNYNVSKCRRRCVHIRKKEVIDVKKYFIIFNKITHLYLVHLFWLLLRFHEINKFKSKWKCWMSEDRRQGNSSGNTNEWIYLDTATITTYILDWTTKRKVRENEMLINPNLRPQNEGRFSGPKTAPFPLLFLGNDREWGQKYNSNIFPSAAHAPIARPASTSSSPFDQPKKIVIRRSGGPKLWTEKRLSSSHVPLCFPQSTTFPRTQTFDSASDYSGRS